MKKFLHIALIIGAIGALMCSCEKEPKVDGKAEFVTFTITAEANPDLELTRNYAAVIDQTACTVLVPLPDSTDVTALVPTFTLTQDDSANILGAPFVSGQTVMDLTEPLEVKVEDPMSMTSKDYTITYANTDGIAELTKVGFYAASNEGKLTTDVEPISIASTMTVAFPGEASQSYVLTVEATLDDVVTFNGKEATYKEITPEVEEGKDPLPTIYQWSGEVDCSFPVDIVVSDVKAGIEINYVIKIVKDTYGESWQKVGSIAELPRADYAMEIDPVTGDLYIAHTLENEEVDDDCLTVKKWDGSKFVTIGDTKISAKRATYINLAARGGKVYVMYTDNTVSSKQTVQMWNGSAWTVLGAVGEMEKHTGLSKWRTPIEVGVDGKLFAACTASADIADYGVTKRGLHLGIWDGSAWSHYGTVGGRDAAQITYLNRLAVAGDDVYLMCANQNEKTTSVYKYSAGAWTCPVNEYKMDPEAEEIATYFGTMKGFANGDVYFALGERVYGTDNWYLQLFKLAGDTLERVYAPIQDNQGSDAAFDFEFDANGNPILIYFSSKTETMKLVTIDPETQTWTYPADLGESSYNGNPAFMQKTPAGDIYTTFVKQNQELDAETGKTVKTYEVVLYKKIK